MHPFSGPGYITFPYSVRRGANFQAARRRFAGMHVSAATVEREHEWVRERTDVVDQRDHDVGSLADPLVFAFDGRS